MPELDAQARERLRSTQFAYVDSHGEEHLPLNDEAHVRNAIARFNQTDFESKAARNEPAGRSSAPPPGTASKWRRIRTSATRFDRHAHADPVPVRTCRRRARRRRGPARPRADRLWRARRRRAHRHRRPRRRRVGDGGLRSPPSGRRPLPRAPRRGRWVIRGFAVAGGALLAIAVAVGMVAAWRVVLVAFLAILVGLPCSDRRPCAADHPVAARPRRPSRVRRLLRLRPDRRPGDPAGRARQVGDLAGTIPPAIDNLRRDASGLQPPALAASLTALLDAASQALRPGQPPQAGDVVAAGLTVADLAVTGRRCLRSSTSG